jgi:hypothetical protein
MALFWHLSQVELSQVKFSRGELNNLKTWIKPSSSLALKKLELEFEGTDNSNLKEVFKEQFQAKQLLTSFKIKVLI